jgi:hypothetical protein
MIATYLRRASVLSLAFLLALVVGCSGKTDGDNAADTSSPGGDKKGDGSKKPVVSRGAKVFADECGKDPKAAEEKYKGKLVELSGTVIEIGASEDGKPFVDLQGDSRERIVRCLTQAKEPWALVIPGQQVKLHGKFEGAGEKEIRLSDSIIVAPKSSPALNITAEKLAKEFKAAEEDTKGKYDGKYLIVEGEVVDKKADGSYKFLHLKGDADTPMICRFDKIDDASWEALKMGQRAKAVGQFSKLVSEDGPTVIYCQAIGLGK